MIRNLLFRSLVAPFLLCSLHARGQDADSLSVWPTDSVCNSPANVDAPHRLVRTGLPLFAAGTLLRGVDGHIRDIRHSYSPEFKNRFDDVLQYAPGIVMLSLKACGVRGRSSWPRMLVSGGFSASIMAIGVNSLKYGIGRRRPDESSRNSFPSGHTATAFMMATVLHKEYGETRSPLYSVLGYSLATGTAVGRQLNNRHWFSDVVAGAGIGIVSTQVGYYLADLIFKERGLEHPPGRWSADMLHDTYATLGIQVGYSFDTHGMNLPENIEIVGKGGATTALTGSWYFTPHWGIGAKFGVAQSLPSLNIDRFSRNHPAAAKEVGFLEIPPIAFYSGSGGIHYKTRILPGLFAGGSLMAGLGHVKDYRIDFRRNDESETRPLLQTSASKPFPNVDLTAHLTHIAGQNLAVRFYLNYHLSKARINYTYHSMRHRSEAVGPINGIHRFTLRHLSVGAEVSALIWK